MMTLLLLASAFVTIARVDAHMLLLAEATFSLSHSRDVMGQAKKLVTRPLLLSHHHRRHLPHQVCVHIFYFSGLFLLGSHIVIMGSSEVPLFLTTTRNLLLLSTVNARGEEKGKPEIHGWLK